MEDIVNPEAAIPKEEQGATVEAGEDQPAESATQEGEPETAISEGTPSEKDSDADKSFCLEVKYNKAQRALNRDEAVSYAEQGIFYENTVKPIYNKLDYIAAQRGQTIEEVVDRMLSADEEYHRQELIERFGEDSEVIDDLMRLYRDSQRQKYEKIVSDREAAAAEAENQRRETLEARLASEFEELKKEFPEVKEFAALPKAVKTQAAQGRDLLSAYLRYRYSESKKAADAQTDAAYAAKATTGAASSGVPITDSVDAAFLSGVFRKQ